MHTTKKIAVGNVWIGGGESIKIQSMTSTKTSDLEKTIAQITALEKAGCEIVRVAVLDEADALAIKQIKQRISIPLVADIHFSPKLAVLSIENGADKVRINPGNIGGEKEIRFVADDRKERTGSAKRSFRLFRKTRFLASQAAADRENTFPHLQHQG